MSYYVEQNHKFFAVRTNSCHALQGYAHKKRMDNWLNTQTQFDDELEIISRETLIERGNAEVTVYALFTNKPVKLRAKDVGGCCDPSTERYHSM